METADITKAILAEQSAALDREEDVASAAVTEKRREKVIDYLPKSLADHLEAMDAGKRWRRETAILKKIGWDDLALCTASADEISDIAKARAAQYARKHPKSNPEYQTAEHRRGRDEGIQRRRLRKRARKVRGYIGQAVAGVGGKDADTRQNYVTDFSVERHRDDVRSSHERMEKLRILKVTEPTVQISMLDAHKRKMEREAAKKRLLIDLMLKRAETIGAIAVWITITLPGAFHSNPTNAGHEASEWNPDFGPDEQMQEIQHRYHQTMNLLRELGCRPWGFWSAQAQQDGTVHRHLELFVHDREMTEAEALALLDDSTPEAEKTRIREASAERVLQEARTIATEFRKRFPGVRGCRAEVIGDTHPDFKPKKDKRGDEETAASVAKYLARYATRLSTGAGDSFEVEGEDGGKGKADAPDKPITDMERHAVWASERDARLLNFVGLDSQRSPSRAWDCVWKAAERGEVPDNRRMGLAVENMMAAQGLIEQLVEMRKEQAKTKEYVDLLRSQPDGGIGREAKRLEKSLKDETAESAWEKHRLVFLQGRLAKFEARLAAETEEGQAERLAHAETVLERLNEDVATLNDEIATYAYQACLAFGFWADRDLHISERLWLREELGAGQDLPLPPIPLRKERQNAFDETVRETVGIAAPVVIATGTVKNRAEATDAMCDGAMLLTAEDGSWRVVAPSENTTNQILLKTEEWIIVDEKTAKEKVLEAEQKEAERNAAAIATADAARDAAMKAYQAECAELEAETSADVESAFEGESVVEEGASGCDALSLIATDPRHCPADNPRVDFKNRRPAPG